MHPVAVDRLVIEYGDPPVFRLTCTVFSSGGSGVKIFKVGRESWQGPCLISDQDPDVKAHLPSLILAKCVNPDPYKGVLEGEVLAFKYSFNTSSVGRGTSSGFWTYPIDGKTPPDIRLQYDNQDDWEILGVHEGKLEGPQPANLPDRPHVLAIKDHPTFFLPLRYFPTCGAYIYAGETGPEFCFDYRVVYTDSLLVEFPVTGKRSVFVWSSNEKAFVGPGGNWLNQYSEYRILGVHAVRDSTSKVEAVETAAPPPVKKALPLPLNQDEKERQYLIGLHWADALLSRRVCHAVALPQEPPPQLDLYNQFQFHLNRLIPTIKKEELHMSTLKIEQVVQINGVNASQFTPEQLLEMIRGQKRAVSELEALNVSSVKVNNMITEHLENVRKLVDILDGRDRAVEQEQPK